MSCNNFTRKSSRPRVLTSKAKQYQLDSKPVLRSISTIDEDENTYNSLSFKKRKLQDNQANEEEPQQQIDAGFQYNSNIDNDDDDNESVASEDDEESVLNQMSHISRFENDGSEFSSQSDDDLEEDDFFNSDDENEYYSAISDYENDIKPKFNDVKVVEVSQSKFLNNNDLFKNTHTHSSNNCELRSLEENFQKIINEHQDKSKSSTPSTPSTPISTAFPTFSTDSISIDDFVDYSDDLVDSSASDSAEASPASPLQAAKSSKFLQYRHDERHNLAFPDVSTFPIRYDPSANVSAYKSARIPANKRMFGGRIRALKRRAILEGRASEMVGTGISNFGEFTF